MHPHPHTRPADTRHKRAPPSGSRLTQQRPRRRLNDARLAATATAPGGLCPPRVVSRRRQISFHDGLGVPYVYTPSWSAETRGWM